MEINNNLKKITDEIINKTGKEIQKVNNSLIEIAVHKGFLEGIKFRTNQINKLVEEQKRTQQQ